MTGPNSFIETLTHSKEESFVLNFVIETVTLVKQIQKYFEIKLVLDVNSKFILVALKLNFELDEMDKNILSLTLRQQWVGNGVCTRAGK